MPGEQRPRRRRQRRASRDEDLDSEGLERFNQHYGWPCEHSKDPSKEPSWWYLSWRSCGTPFVKLWCLCHAVFGNFVALVVGLSSCVGWPMAIIVVGFAIIIISLTVAYIAYRWFNMTEVAGMMFANAFAIAWGGVSSMLARFAATSLDTAPPLHEWHLKPVLPTVDLLIPGLRALQRDLDFVNVEYQLSDNLMVPLRAFEELDEEINMEYDKALEDFNSVRHQLHNIIHMPKIEPTVSNPSFYYPVYQWVRGKRPSDILQKQCKEVISALESLHAAHANRHKLITDSIWAQMGSVATDVCETASRIQKLDKKSTSSDHPSIATIKKDATLVAGNYCQSIKRKRTELRATEQQLVKDHRAIAALLSNAKQSLAKMKDMTDLQEKAIRHFQDECEDIAKEGLDNMRKFYKMGKA